MWQLEIKIISLTLIYFAGWFLFEKVIMVLYNRCFNKEAYKAPKKKRKIIQLSSAVPADQTMRYIKGTTSPDWRIRRISCIQLGERRGTAVIEALIACLDDPRNEVSLAAGDALAKIGDTSAIEALSAHCVKLEENSLQSYEHYKAA